jgi:hypothetical protein
VNDVVPPPPGVHVGDGLGVGTTVGLGVTGGVGVGVAQLPPPVVSLMTVKVACVPVVEVAVVAVALQTFVLYSGLVTSTASRKLFAGLMILLPVWRTSTNRFPPV